MKTLNGIVVAKSMDKTAIVEVIRRTPHKLYKKLIKQSKRYSVDTKGKDVIVGSQVTIVGTRPISKNKHFRLQ